VIRVDSSPVVVWRGQPPRRGHAVLARLRDPWNLVTAADDGSSRDAGDLVGEACDVTALNHRKACRRRVVAFPTSWQFEGDSVASLIPAAAQRLGRSPICITQFAEPDSVAPAA
jgi:hypothetical protein